VRPYSFMDAVYDMVITILWLCPSVCPSHSGFVSERLLNISWKSIHHRIALVFNKYQTRVVRFEWNLRVWYCSFTRTLSYQSVPYRHVWHSSCVGRRTENIDRYRPPFWCMSIVISVAPRPIWLFVVAATPLR